MMSVRIAVLSVGAVRWTEIGRRDRMARRRGDSSSEPVGAWWVWGIITMALSRKQEKKGKIDKIEENMKLLDDGVGLRTIRQ